jgi:pSer/pThr/pTyr-binding forkhead associated (FHA) protein
MEPSYPGEESANQSKDQNLQLQVVVHAGPLAGKGYLFTGEMLTFGRDPDNDITWDDGQVSRHHARLTRQGDLLLLEDLGSTNGTLVNGQPISDVHTLQPADIISIGSSVFGVKGFAAPQTVAITQITARPPELVPDAAPRRPQPAKRRSPPPSPRPKPPKAPVSSSKQGRGGVNILAIAGVITVILVILGLAALTAYFIFVGQRGTGVQVPNVVITAPAPGSQVRVGQSVFVQATASDPTGVVRMELWVSGLKTAETSSPAAQGQPTLPVQCSGCRRRLAATRLK